MHKGINEVERLHFLLNEIFLLKEKILPSGTGHIHTTISCLESQVADCKEALYEVVGGSKHG
jgi:hypothetical protein|tara:strand:- start:2303 stop:2488 length:186 start_codon:yes stop_codon:yes gene_type:complete